MGDKPKTFLRKGQGKYTKIEYPVLRRSGAYQPPPDTPTSRNQKLSTHSSSTSLPQSRLPPSNPSLNSHSEIQRSPSESERSRTSDSLPRAKSFGSSLERRMGESDEGVEMSNSPRLNSCRPLTAGTADSGFPMDELPLLSPSSSSRDTRASSIPSMVDDLTLLRLQNSGGAVSRSPAAAAARAADEERINVAADTAAPSPKTRKMYADGSLIGDTTDEFEQRELRELRRDRRDAATPSSTCSSTLSITNEVRQDMKELLKTIGEDKEEVLERPQPQRKVHQQLNESISTFNEPSPIGSQTQAKSVQEFEGATFRESIDSRRDSTSHFQMQSFSGEEDYQRADESMLQLRKKQPERRRSLDERSETSSGSTADARRYLIGDRRPLDEIRIGRNGEEVTAAQQRRPLHLHPRASQATFRHPLTQIREEISPSYSNGEHDETMPQPSRRDRRGEMRNEAKMMDGETLRRERREVAEMKEELRLMETQLLDAIAHSDMADAALRRMKSEQQTTFENVIRSLADSYARKEEQLTAAVGEKEKKMDEERRMEKERLEQMRLDLEKEKRLLRKDETAKFEEMQKKYAEEMKKKANETSKSRLKDEKTKKERDEATAKISSLETENERMKKMNERLQRERVKFRGKSPLHSVMNRVDDEAAATPMRKGILKRMNSLPQKENLRSSSSISPSTLEVPQEFLNRNHARLEDAYTIEPLEHELYEIEQGEDEAGPYAVYADNFGCCLKVSEPNCGCAVYKYGNGDAKHFTPDRSVVFHYFASSASIQFDFPQQRCQVFYSADGFLEIYRTGKEITKCISRGDNIERRETIKRMDGSIYEEIWNNNLMAICEDGRMGEFSEQFNTGGPLISGKRSTLRDSWVGKSHVGLHLSRNVEFFEPNFYAVYNAKSKEVQLYLNHKQPDEIQYTLRAGKPGVILHTRHTTPKCTTFGQKY